MLAMDRLLAVKAAAITERDAAIALDNAENALRDRVKEAIAAGADFDLITLAAKASFSITAEHVTKLAKVAQRKRAK